MLLLKRFVPNVVVSLMAFVRVLFSWFGFMHNVLGARKIIRENVRENVSRIWFGPKIGVLLRINVHVFLNSFYFNIILTTWNDRD